MQVTSAPVDTDQVRALVSRAADLLGTGGFPHADEVLALLQPLQERQPPLDPALAGDVHYWIGMAYYRSTRYADARAHFEVALKLARAARDRAAEARAWRWIAQLHKNKGEYAEGLAACEQAIIVELAAGNARGVANVEVIKGAILDSMGEHKRALESYRRALPSFDGETSHESSNLLHEIAITEKNLGNYGEALRYYNAALSQQVQLKDANAQAFTFLNLGVLYTTLGDDQRAIGYTLEALRLARQVGNRRAEGLLLNNLGEEYWRLGQTRRALETLEEELILARAQHARGEENETLKTLGDIYFAEGDLERARSRYEEALRIERDIGDRRTEASTLLALADLALREADREAAADSARQALAIARDTGQRELEWSAERALARADAAGGRTAEAIEELRSSARIINDLRANVDSDADKIAFVDQRQDVFQDLAVLLVEAGRVGEGLEAAEAGRARALADLLQQRQVIGKPRERDALAAVRQARTDFLRTIGTSASVASETASGDALRRTRGVAFETSLTALGADHHELASLLTAESPTMAGITQSTKRLDATLVEYLVTGRRLLIWVVGRDGAVHAATVDVARDRIASLVTKARTRIDSARKNGFRRSPALDASLRELDRLLVAPIADWLPASPAASVIIVPQGPLALLPFAALVDDRGRALAERQTLSFAPAASIYEHTSDKRLIDTERQRRALIVADPTPPDGSGIDRLPGAREEGRRVAARLAGMPVRVLVGANASEAAVKREAGEYTLLHFATHGLIAPDRPLASSLLLAAGGGEDGYLRADEVFNLELHADLVVLSGCSTGLGRLTGDGILGLTRAFVYAGTPSVVVTQWDVSDRATTFLMDEFYRSLTRGLSKAAALRAAQLATRRRFAHPALWAAFELVGEPR